MSNAHLLKPSAANYLRANIAFYAVLIAGSVLMVGPFGWMLSTALKVPGDQFDHRLIPTRATLENFSKAWSLMNFRALLTNSLTIATLSTIGQVITCSMAAFGFAVVKFRGREALFLLLLATLMVPNQMMIIPQFLIFKALGL